jgi:cation diffusion facilitator CzcD-associated flavoprotein CzcO
VPLETRYYEAYNRDNVHLVDISETPIERITAKGIKTTEKEYEFDIIVYATGFDAITGAFDRIDIRGTGGEKLRDKWRDGPSTLFGMMVHGFPNFITVAGPQSGSSSTNFPRSIEIAVDWVTGLLDYAWDHGYTRLEATQEAEDRWTGHVAKMYQMMLMRKGKGWFTGYNSNVEGHEAGKIRYFVYNGGAPKYRATLLQAAADDYKGIVFDTQDRQEDARPLVASVG